MASYQIYKSGIGSVGSYQIAGVPYITGSAGIAAGAEDKISFPKVARAVTVVLNTDTRDVRVHFNSTSSGNVVSGRHYVLLDSKEDSVTLNNRCTEIYISADAGNAGTAAYTVIAELTGIETSEMGALTGSGLTE
jgi:predicted DNA binding protein